MKYQISAVYILMLFSFYSCKTSNYIQYHRIINEAEYSYFNSDYKNAAQLYQKAFQKVKKPFESDMYYCSVSLWEVGEHDKSIALLDTLMGVEWALTKSGYFQGIDSLKMKEIIKRNKEKLAIIERRRDSNPLLVVFESINEKDQKVRKNWKEIVNNNPNDSIAVGQAWREVEIIDSLNLLTVDSLIKIHGFIGGVHFPAYPKIMHLTIIHQLEWVYKNPRLFKKAIKQGRLSPEEYAIAYDKSLLIYVGDTVVRYGQFTSKLEGVKPEKLFKQAKKIGVSPYFNEWVVYPRRKGGQPKKHLYYEYYKGRKNRFSCY